jgi:hypothetical protein
MEAARIALHAGTNESAGVFCGLTNRECHAGQAVCENSLQEKQRESNMKKLSHMPMLLAALLALTSFTLAQQPEGQGDPDKLVEIVRNATQKYQDVTKATADGYSPVLGCVSGSDHGAMGIHYVNSSLVARTITHFGGN